MRSHKEILKESKWINNEACESCEASIDISNTTYTKLRKSVKVNEADYILSKIMCGLVCGLILTILTMFLNETHSYLITLAVFMLGSVMCIFSATTNKNKLVYGSVILAELVGALLTYQTKYTVVISYSHMLCIIPIFILIYMNLNIYYNRKINIIPEFKYIHLLIMGSIALAWVMPDYCNLIELKSNSMYADKMSLSEFREDARYMLQDANLLAKLRVEKALAKDKNVYAFGGISEIEKTIVDEACAYEIKSLADKDYSTDYYNKAYENIGNYIEDGKFQVYDFLDTELANIKDEYTYEDFLNQGASIKSATVEAQIVGRLHITDKNNSLLKLINTQVGVGSEILLAIHSNETVTVLEVEKYSEEEFNKMGSRELGPLYIQYVKSVLDKDASN